MKKSCSIVVLNTISEWKDLHASMLDIDRKPMLRRCLESVAHAMKSASSDYDVECHVISSRNGDRCEEIVEARFAFVKLSVVGRGRFLFLYNDFVKQLRSDYVILLNNDVMVSEGFISPMLRHLEKDNAFAVSPRMMTWKNGAPDGLEVGYREANFWRGMLGWRTLDCDTPRLTLYAHGGASAYDREKFVELGGFDELYLPYFYEDIDISYRAWKRGWTCVSEPSSFAYHMCSETINRGLSANRNESIRKKNQLLFHWKNVSDRRLLANHLLLVAARLVASPFMLNTAFPQAFWMALGQAREAVSKRRQEQGRTHNRSDREILAILDGRLAEVKSRKPKSYVGQ